MRRGPRRAGARLLLALSLLARVVEAQVRRRGRGSRGGGRGPGRLRRSRLLPPRGVRPRDRARRGAPPPRAWGGRGGHRGRTAARPGGARRAPNLCPTRARGGHPRPPCRPGASRGAHVPGRGRPGPAGGQGPVAQGPSTCGEPEAWRPRLRPGATRGCVCRSHRGMGAAAAARCGRAAAPAAGGGTAAGGRGARRLRLPQSQGRVMWSS